MKTFDKSWELRIVAIVLVALAMLWLAGCATTKTPDSVTLDGIVVDGTRVAQPGETGMVRIYRAGAWIEGQTSMPLQSGDWVATGPRGFALIRYPSGTELFMRPNTHGRIGSFTEMVGEVFAKIRGAFAVQTTFVKAGAEGTAYLVRAAPSGEATVVVVEGTVGMSSLAGTWPPYRMGAGSMSVTQARGGSPRLMRATAEELAATQAWVERMETLMPPPRQINKAATALAVIGVVGIIAALRGSGDSDVDRERPSRGGSGVAGPELGWASGLSLGRAVDESATSARATATLAAPARATPGSASPEQAAMLDDCRSLALSWRAVAGARDYAVTLDGAAPASRRAWQAVAIAPTASTQVAVDHLLQLNTLYRWVVRAHDAQGHAGAATAARYFRCRGGVR